MVDKCDREMKCDEGKSTDSKANLRAVDLDQLSNCIKAQIKSLKMTTFHKLETELVPLLEMAFRKVERLEIEIMPFQEKQIVKSRVIDRFITKMFNICPRVKKLTLYIHIDGTLMSIAASESRSSPVRHQSR